MSKPLVIIAVRSNVDWANMDKSKFFSQEQTRINDKVFKDAPHTTLAGKQRHWKFIQMWDSILTVPYFEMRYHMKSIAEKSHTNISGVDVILKGKEAIYKFVERYKDDKWIMFPTDDDDFYSPAIVNKVLGFTGHDFTGIHVVSWNTLRLNTCGVLELGPNPKYGSNSYALTNKVAKKFPHRLQEIIARHSVAGEVSGELLDDDLSLYNYNISCLSSLTKEKDIINQWDKATLIGYFKNSRPDVPISSSEWVFDYQQQIFQVLRACIDFRS